MTSRWLDSPDRYGWLARLLHWSMALLLAWQFAGMVLKEILGRHPVSAFFVGSHKPVGTLLLLLVVARALWALSQWKRRPRHGNGWIGKAATIGHALLYALMLYVPAVALLRQYGSGKAFAPWGIPLFPERAQEIAWMLAPADASHGLLAWLLLATIAGHVTMVAIHQWWWRDTTLSRMTGPIRR